MRETRINQLKDTWNRDARMKWNENAIFQLGLLKPFFVWYCLTANTLPSYMDNS